MKDELAGRKIAILATDGFEQVELTSPKENVESAGAKTEVLSVKEGSIKGWKSTDWGDSVKVDRLVSTANTDDYDALILPGGQINPDDLRTNKDAVAFVKKFAESGKPLGAICHGPSTLIEAGVVKGKTMTSWPSLHVDLSNAGADWVDQEIAEDGNILTSRNPADLPAFSKKLIEKTHNSPQFPHDE